MHRYTISLGSEALTSDAFFKIDMSGAAPGGVEGLTDGELNTLADQLAVTLNAKFSATDYEVIGITRADQTNVPVI